MQLSWDPIYDSSSVGMALAILVIALLIWVTPSTSNPRRRGVLLALRALAATMILLAMWRPGLVRRDNRPAAATLAIAMDTSRSMTLASGEAGAEKTRWEQQQRVLKEVAEQISKLDDSLNVTLYQYDQSARTVGTGPASTITELIARSTQEPDGNLTDLDAPLRAAMSASRRLPLAGVTLISDGTQTAVLSENPDVESTGRADPIAAARLLGAMGVPLWTVAVGPSAEGVRVQDVAVKALPETYRMFSGNETEIAFEIQSQGYTGATLPVSLFWVDREGKRIPAATRSVVSQTNSETRKNRETQLNGESQSNRESQSNAETQSVRVPLIAPAAGRYRLIVEAEVRPGEIDDSNNRQLAFVDVRSGGGRVLYVEGTPRLEQTFLRRALRRFPDLELSYRWIPRDTSSRWPIDMADDLQSDHFDVVIIGDLHSLALGKKQLSELADLIGDGTALVTLGGEHAYGPGGYADSPLTGVLPIRMDDSLMQIPGSAPATSSSPGQESSPVSLRVVQPHPITNIVDDSANWSTVAPMPGANRWAGVRAAPGVQVLLEDANGQPMMVVGEYGKGRVASLAFDSTWTWWRSGNSEFHRRFWRQLMLWLLSREETDATEIEIEMTHRRFLASGGSDFTATLNLFDPNATDSPKSLNATVVLESGESLKMKTINSRRGESSRQVLESTGSLPDDVPPGIHTLRFETEDGQPSFSNEIPFQVIDDTRELTAGVADHARLSRLAIATAESGGKAFRADQTEALIQRILSQRKRAEKVVIEKFRLGDDLVTAWILFTIFAGSLSTEWFFRRKWDLA